ncbi:MAG: hypothetical protein WC357_01680 [Candidatus Omnitrophota bacterium]|jgi:hypothetical protein
MSCFHTSYFTTPSSNQKFKHPANEITCGTLFYNQPLLSRFWLIAQISSLRLTQGVIAHDSLSARKYVHPQKHTGAAGSHFSVTRAREYQFIIIIVKLTDNFISIMKTTETQSLLKTFFGKTPFKIGRLSPTNKKVLYQNRLPQ